MPTSILFPLLFFFILILFANRITFVQSKIVCDSNLGLKYNVNNSGPFKIDDIKVKTANLRMKRNSNWSIINEEVDSVIPLVLQHLHKMKVEQFKLPNISQRFALSPLTDLYTPVLYLTNGVVYNLSGINRYGSAYMTYEEKSFLIRFYLNVKNAQFEYDFLLKILPIDGYGKVIGSLKDTIIYLDLGIDVTNLEMVVFDFRLVQFRDLLVQLDETRFIRHLSGVILTPITNLFKERITTSISNNLKGQFQMVIDDFNRGDPLELRKFTKAILGGLTGSMKNETL